MAELIPQIGYNEIINIGSKGFYTDIISTGISGNEILLDIIGYNADISKVTISSSAKSYLRFNKYNRSPVIISYTQIEENVRRYYFYHNSCYLQLRFINLGNKYKCKYKIIESKEDIPSEAITVEL